MTIQTNVCSIDTVIFDFGGVLAEKGFEEGLRAIAVRNGLDETDFLNLSHDLIHTTGYLTGQADEHVYWQAIRDKTGIRDDDATLRNEILSRFILRPWMFDIVGKLRESGINVVILSDQTNWLDELNERYDFFKLFDVVFNSYHLRKSKVDPSHFADTISRLNATPERLLFVDDTGAHCETARKVGINAIQYIDRDSFLKEMRCFFPFL
jgi:putative hydrolase of the HAD superfamily